MEKILDERYIEREGFYGIIMLEEQ